MKKQGFLVFMFLFLQALFFSSCNGDVSKATETEYCTYNTDCTGGKICIDGVCKFECITPADCGNIYVYQCINNRCIKKATFEDVKTPEDTKSTLGNPCDTDSDCLPDAVCIKGKCDRECVYDYDCDGDNYKCDTFRCVKADVEDVKETPNDTAQKIPCTKNLDCKPYEMACINGFCDRECIEDIDCGDPSLYCYAYKCFKKEGDDIKDTKDVVDAVDTVDTADIPDTATDTGVEAGCVSDIPGCTNKPGKYGDPCKCKCECETGLCVSNKSTGAKTCTKECFSDYDCPDKDVCISIPGETIKICYFNDAGYSCQTGCVEGISLTNKLGQCVCTVKCDNASKCPEGFGCSYVMLNNQQVKVCVLANGAMCDPSNLDTVPCYGMCYPLTNTSGFCTIFCDSSLDCPSGMYCKSENIQGTIVKTCQYQ